MDFTTITVQILTWLSHVTGSYGLAIILLTILVRVAMWPLSVSQQKSMKKMQALSPKMKEIQNRYKSDPQIMQKKMMEFYKEHQFNPFGGCFPLILQLPVFILLYSALISPQFIEIAGKTSFLFINRLDATIQSHAGKTGDKIFGVNEHDKFSSSKTATVYVKDGVIKDVQIKDPNKAVQIQGKLMPGKPVDLKISLDELNLSFDQLSKVQKAEISIINNNTKEIEHITFKKQDSLLAASVKTEQDKTTFHYDVLALVILFGITMFFSQKLLSSSTSMAGDPAQQQMQQSMANIMPIMITSTFIFVPIPAGVLLYMVVSNLIQVGQTVIINKQIDAEEAAKKPKADNLPIGEAKTIQAKNIETKEIQSEESGQESSKKKTKKTKW